MAHESRTKALALTLLVVLAPSAVGGCGLLEDRAARNNPIAARRECDSGSVTGIRWLGQCLGTPRLPPTCEKPGTDQRPECQQWVREAYPWSVGQATMLGVAAGN